MAIQDTNQLSEVQLRLLEPDDAGATWPSGYWTFDEVVGYFTDRQRQFVRDTHLILAQLLIPVDSGTSRIDLPEDWVATVRAVWRAKDANGLYTKTVPLGRNDQLAADLGWPRATPPAHPLVFDDVNPPLPGADLVPTPTTDGDLHLLYVAATSALTGDGAYFEVPDECVPFITYGVLADMLGKAGRGQDLPRARYCQRRYEEGVQLAAILLQGFF
jgi:hypothetical protein